METTIKNILVLLLLLAGISAQGQHKINRESEVKSKTEAHGLKKQFSLTDSQAYKCEQVIKKYADKLSEKHVADDSIKFRDTKEQIVKKRDEEIKAILTSDQKSKFDKWVKEKRQPKNKPVK